MTEDAYREQTSMVQLKGPTSRLGCQERLHNTASGNRNLTDRVWHNVYKSDR